MTLSESAMIVDKHDRFIDSHVTVEEIIEDGDVFYKIGERIIHSSEVEFPKINRMKLLGFDQSVLLF